MVLISKLNDAVVAGDALCALCLQTGLCEGTKRGIVLLNKQQPVKFIMYFLVRQTWFRCLFLDHLGFSADRTICHLYKEVMLRGMFTEQLSHGVLQFLVFPCSLCKGFKGRVNL